MPTKRSVRRKRNTIKRRGGASQPGASQTNGASQPGAAQPNAAAPNAAQTAMSQEDIATIIGLLQQLNNVNNQLPQALVNIIGPITLNATESGSSGGVGPSSS